MGYRYKKVNKPDARKIFYNGLSVVMIPCKCSIESKDTPKKEMNMFCGDEDTLTMMNRFDREVMYFEDEKCNAVNGYYAHFYITEEDYEQYRLCSMMSE